VAPRFALFAMGYRNRWDFPSKQVLQVYREAGASLLDTVSSGTLEMRLWPGAETGGSEPLASGSRALLDRAVVGSRRSPAGKSSIMPGVWRRAQCMFESSNPAVG